MRVRERRCAHALVQKGLGTRLGRLLKNNDGFREGCDTSGNLVRSGRNQLEIIGNQLEITEIWLEIRNQDPVEIRKSARNHKKSNEKHPLFVSCAVDLSRMRISEIREKSESRGGKSVGNQLEITAKAGNQLEITEIRKSRTPRRPVSYPSGFRI